MLNYETQRINLEGVPNARQLGGYVGADGRRVKNNVILRTGSLFFSSADARRELSERYKLSDIIDLRMDQETVTMPEPEIEGARYHHLSVLNDMPVSEEDFEIYKKLMKSTDLVQKYQMMYDLNIPIDMEQNYRTMVFSEEGMSGYREFFNILLNKPEDSAVLFHCTQGKDRTGVGAILTLSALGVDRETVMADYMLTNVAYGKLLRNIRHDLEKGNVSKEVIDFAMMLESVNECYISPMLDEVDKNYGSIQGYIQSGLGLSQADIERLRELYLEK